jgi:putative flippase GtrA
VPDYHVSNLIGIGFGAVVNFVLGHFWVFSKKPVAAVTRTAED